MIKDLLFSFLLSILSVVIVAYVPIEIALREPGKVYSPYREELDALHSKAEKGLHPSESEYMSSLIEKNNQWFEEHQKEYLQNTATSARAAWKKRNDYLSSVIMLLWAIAFYFFYKHQVKANPFYILSSPVILLLAHLMSILEVVLIALVVLAIWFWGNFSSKNTENEPTTLE